MKRLMMAICALAALSASAETRTWLANVDGDWNTPGMWSGSAVPGSGDTADFSNLTGDKTINLPAAVTVAGIVYSPTVGATTNKLTLAGAALSVGTSVTVGEKAQLRTTCDVKATANIYTYGSGEWVVAKTLKGNSNGRKLYQREGRITLASGATMGYGINLYPGTTDATLPPAEFVVEEGATADFDTVSAFQFAEAENSRFVFTMNGGTLLPRNATSSGCVLNGKGCCGHGVMNINGGLVDGTGKGFWISYYGTGVVNQTAGKMIWKSVAANYTNTTYATATYNLTGGELWFADNFQRGKSEYAHPYLNVGDAKIVKTGTGNLAVSSPLTIAERFEVDVTNAAYTCNISCTMSGQGGLVKTGPGVLNLYSAEKKFAGPLVVSNGTLQVNANMSGSNAVTVAGGTLRAYDNKSYVFGSLTICGTGTLLTTNTATFKLPLDANLVTVEDDGVLVLGKGRNPFVTNPALQINGNGKVRIPAGAAQWFPSVKKGAENIPDGIYTSSTCDVVDGDGTLVVGNCVWSGTAGNGLWTTAANWQDGATPFTAMAGADLSAATGTLTLDAAVTNAALVYAPAAGNVLTNRSDVVLSLGESSVITVGTGSTLVLDGDTCLLNGTIYKRGGGTLVLARKLTAGASSTVYLRVQEGRCVVDGAVANVSLNAGLWSGSVLTETPEIVFGPNSSLSGSTSLAGVGSDASIDPAPGNGLFTQLGGTVRPAPSSTTVATLAQVRSGQTAATGTYHLVNGVFEIPSDKVLALGTSPSPGVFVQDGGESRIAKLGNGNSGSYGEVTLNGGSMSIGAFGTGNAAQFNFAGGTFAPLGETLTSANAWSLLGSTTFNVANGATLTFSMAPGGTGALVKTGAGTMTLQGGATQSNDVTVTAGVLAVGTGSAFGTLSLAEGTTISLSGVSTATNFTLAGESQPADEAVYSESNCSFISGSGVLLVGGVPGKWNGLAGDGKWSSPGNWSGNIIPNGTAMDVDLSAAADTLVFDAGDLTVGSLVYDTDGATTLTNAALSGSGGDTLSLAANGVITVGEGDTLVVDHPLCLTGQDAYKRGKGTLVLRQGMCVVAERALQANYFNIEEGLVVNEGCVTNVCPVPGAKDRSDPANVPQFINRGDDASMVGNTFISAMHFRAKSGDEDVTDPGNGVFTQDGGVVAPNMIWVNQAVIGYAPQGATAGGTGTYHLVRGTLRIPSGKSSGMHAYNGFGILTQDGGLFENNGNFEMAKGIVTLNGGTMRLSAVTSAQPITLAGGTFRPLSENFTFSSYFNLTGNGVFEIDEGNAMTLSASNPLHGSAPLNKTGAGTLVITGRGAEMTGPVNVNAGTLRLTGLLPNVTDVTVAAGATLEVATGSNPSLSAQTALRMEAGGKVNLTGTGTVSVDALWFGSIPKVGHGRRYGSSSHVGEVDVVDDKFFSGTGVLVVTGSSFGEGTVIIFR